jgi:hypothetical protein
MAESDTPHSLDAGEAQSSQNEECVQTVWQVQARCGSRPPQAG